MASKPLRDVTRAAPVAEPLAVLGSTGLNETWGISREEQLRELRGIQGVRTYREMATDPIISAGLTVFKLLIRQADWSIEAAPAHTPEDEARAEFLAENRDDMSHTWPEFLDEALSMLDYGWAYFEMLFKFRRGQSDDPTQNSRFTDGAMGWRAFSLRSQDTLERWARDEAGELLGMVQQDPHVFTSVLIPLNKALLFRPSAHKGNPEGRSVQRGCYDAHFYKTHARRFEGMGLERDAVGMPICRIPAELLSPTADANQKKIAKVYEEIATRVRRGRQEGLVFPSDRDEHGQLLYDFGLVPGSGPRQFDIDKIINRYNKEIAIALLADVLLVGHESRGSFALASAKTNLMSIAIGAYMDAIRDVLNRFAVPMLFQLNPQFGKADALPTFEHGDVEVPDMAEIAALVTAFAGAGVDISDEPTQAWLRRIAGMPPLELGAGADPVPPEDPPPPAAPPPTPEPAMPAPPAEVPEPGTTP